MKLRRRWRDSPAVSLFPFLAVLVCTMGVLILLLVFAVKSADTKARRAKQREQQKLQKQVHQLTFQLETEKLRIEGLSQFRPAVKHRLEEERLRRSHLEQELRNLREVAHQLKQQWQQLDEDVEVAKSSLNADRQKFELLKQRIAARKSELAELRDVIAHRPTIYSIVPTQSKHGTLRRPIYVECTSSGIVLRPCGIRIALDEFSIPIIPGNPLDAALLAIREYWNNYSDIGEEGEPYPLLVVRPGGATAYAIARRAMQSWDDEFGYELVEAEKVLDFGAQDKNLTEIVEQTVQDAMRKQRQWVALQQSAQPGGNRSKLARRLRRDLNSRIIDEMASPEAADPTAITEQGLATGNKQTENPLRNSLQLSTLGEANHAAAPGNPDMTAHSRSNDPPDSLADQRGADWALPTRTPGATAYRRPIRIECGENHLLVYSGDVHEPPAKIDMSSSIESTVDQLVEQVWRQIESWGMAEAGGFWKPVLRLRNLPGGRDRAQQLARLLEGSGLEIEGDWR